MKLWKDSFRCLPDCLNPSLGMQNCQIVVKNKIARKEKDTCLWSVDRQGKDPKVKPMFNVRIVHLVSFENISHNTIENETM